jgi:hypothetical protein
LRAPGDIGICKQQQIKQHHPQVRVPGNIETYEQHHRQQHPSITTDITTITPGESSWKYCNMETKQIQQQHSQVRVPGNIGTCKQQQIHQHHPRKYWKLLTAADIATISPVESSWKY